MGTTTRDEIDINLDGSIDNAIAELTRLKALYPKGTISLESEYSYGESYPRLRLRFTRPKAKIEIELERWQDKRRQFQDMENAAVAYEREGDPYPRADELAALREELGPFADRMASLAIYEDEIVAHGFEGIQRRDGTWLARSFFSLRRDSDTHRMAETEGLGAKPE